MAARSCVFSDYARPAIRLAAMMHPRVIHVMTHDSIGLGEDGPTHQPVEHARLAAGDPHLHVSAPPTRSRRRKPGNWRCSNSTGHSCWRCRGRTCHRAHRESGREISALGAYVLAEAPGERDVTQLRDRHGGVAGDGGAENLAPQNIQVAVRFGPLFRLFARAGAALSGRSARPSTAHRHRSGCPARVGCGVGPNGYFIGMSEFGASAPAGDLYKFFGITVDAIVQAARAAAGHRHSAGDYFRVGARRQDQGVG